MKNFLLWISFFLVWAIGSILVVWGSAIFISWMFPLKTLKDWIVALLLFLPVIATLFAQAYMAMVAISISPKPRAAAIIVFVLSLGSIPLSLLQVGMPDNAAEWVQAIQLIITIFTAIYYMKNPYAAKKNNV